MGLLKPFAQPGRFWRGNLHTHSNLSDGAFSPQQVIAAYQKAGYDFITLSEHFLKRFGYPIADTTSFRSNSFTTILGAELHAPVTNAGELWHILANGLPLDFAHISENETGPSLAKRAREAGAYITIAHPAWSRYTIDDGRALIASAHAVEIYNHGCAIENDLGDGWYLHDQLLNEGHRLNAIATDDAHFKTPDHFGGWVNVKTESLNPDALLSALKAGDFYSSQGPEFYSISLDRKDISITCTAVNCISVVSGISRSCVRYGEAITDAKFDLSSLEQGWLLEKTSPWFRVVAIDNAGKKAWSNAYWWADFFG